MDFIMDDDETCERCIPEPIWFINPGSLLKIRHHAHGGSLFSRKRDPDLLSLH